MSSSSKSLRSKTSDLSNRAHTYTQWCTLLARLNFLHTPIRKKRSFFCFFFLLLFFFTFSLSMSSSSKSLRSKTSDLSNRAHTYTQWCTLLARLNFLHTPIRKKRSFFCFFFLLLFFFTFS